MRLHIFASFTMNELFSGDSTMESSWMLAVDGDIHMMSSSLQSPIMGICVLFASYFNLHYPSDTMATLEFLQRWVGGCSKCSDSEIAFANPGDSCMELANQNVSLDIQLQQEWEATLSRKQTDFMHDAQSSSYDPRLPIIPWPDLWG